MEFLACTAFDVTRDEPLHIEVIYFELRFEVEEFPWEMFSFFLFSQNRKLKSSRKRAKNLSFPKKIVAQFRKCYCKYLIKLKHTDNLLEIVWVLKFFGPFVCTCDSDVKRD